MGSEADMAVVEIEMSAVVLFVPRAVRALSGSTMPMPPILDPLYRRHMDQVLGNPIWLAVAVSSIDYRVPNLQCPNNNISAHHELGRRDLEKDIK